MSFHSELSSHMRAQLLNLSTKRLSRNTQILRTAYNHFFFLHISRDRHTFKVKTCQKYQREATLKATEVKKLLSQDTGHLSFHALHPLYLTISCRLFCLDGANCLLYYVLILMHRERKLFLRYARKSLIWTKYMMKFKALLKYAPILPPT